MISIHVSTHVQKNVQCVHDNIYRKNSTYMIRVEPCTNVHGHAKSFGRGNSLHDDNVFHLLIISIQKPLCCKLVN